MESGKFWNSLLERDDVSKLSKLFHISRLGFLPETCCDKLPMSFAYLEPILANLSELTTPSAEKFRALVDTATYQENSIDNLTLSENYYLYSVLTMIVNRYIWCSGVSNAQKYNKIPPSIAVPLYLVSKNLGIAPTLTHASVDLWNWRRVKNLDAGPGVFSPDTIENIHTLTGDPSESWFYRVMIAIEGTLGECVLIAPIIHKFYNKPEQIQIILTRINEKIIECVGLIKRMYGGCDAAFFFNRLRIYLSGSKNDNLPDGVYLDLRPIGLGLKNIKLIGGSAAQSSVIQMFDLLFGVEHAGGKEFLDTMREYMPMFHKNYLKIISDCPSLRLHVTSSGNIELIRSFNQCTDSLVKFREAHMGLVRHYIMKQIPKTNADDKNAHGEKGSGGTSPVEFCQELIDETVGVANESSRGESHKYIMIIVVIIIAILYMAYRRL